MRVDGRCHSGAITYEAEVDPANVGVCHCADCQRLTGSAFRVNVQAPAASFRLTSGTPKIYVKTADSGARRAHAFCPDCGGPVYACAVENPTTYSLRIGALNQREGLVPRRQIWARNRMTWLEDLARVPSLETQ